MSIRSKTVKSSCILLAAILVAGLMPAIGYSQTSNPGPPPAQLLPSHGTAGQPLTFEQLRKRLAGRIAFGEDVINDDLISFDLASPGTFGTIAGLILDSRGTEIIGFDYTQLYMMNAGGDLYRVSSSDGSSTLIGTAELAPSQEIGDLASDQMTGNLYAVTTNCWGTSSLYTIDPLTAEATYIGNTGTSCMVALAADASGTLYGHDLDSDRLYTLSKSTGVATDAGELGFDANYSQGMDCDPITDICYLFAFNDYTGVPELWSFDTLTVTISEIGRLGAVTPGVMVSLGDAAITSPLFADGFESGNTTGWSDTVP
jgi:hypothetical protein